MSHWILQLATLFLLCFSNHFIAAQTTDDPHRSHVIIGSQIAAPGQFPYAVSVHINGQHSCGGTIITENFVLTAAQCVTRRVGIVRQNYPLNQVTIYVGSHNLFDGGVSYPVSQIILHSEYSDVTNANNLALLRSANAIQLNYRTVTPIALSEVALQPGTDVTVVGWGQAIRTNDNPSAVQRFITSKVISNERCARFLPQADNTILCLSNQVNQGICLGDIGGPAVYDLTLVGVANSYINGCASYFPDSYTNVSTLIDWIRTNSDYV